VRPICEYACFPLLLWGSRLYFKNELKKAGKNNFVETSYTLIKIQGFSLSWLVGDKLISRRAEERKLKIDIEKLCVIPRGYFILF